MANERCAALRTRMLGEFVGFTKLSLVVIATELSIFVFSFDDELSTFDTCFNAVWVKSVDVVLYAELLRVRPSSRHLIVVLAAVVAVVGRGRGRRGGRIGDARWSGDPAESRQRGQRHGVEIVIEPWIVEIEIEPGIEEVQ